MPDPKPKPPALDQTEALGVEIPGALPPPMLTDVPIELPPAPDLTDVQTAPPAPMLTDVPIDLPQVVPDAPADTGRPASDAHKDEWVAWAITRGVPSFEAWSLTVPELKKLEA